MFIIFIMVHIFFRVFPRFSPGFCFVKPIFPWEKQPGSDVFSGSLAWMLPAEWGSRVEVAGGTGEMAEKKGVLRWFCHGLTMVYIGNGEEFVVYTTDASNIL